MSHKFSFEESDQFGGMAASWFVSYAYHQYVDKTHFNWQNVADKSLKSRIGKFNASLNNHHYWLGQVISMSDDRIATNQLGLSAADVKKMAKTLYTII